MSVCCFHLCPYVYLYSANANGYSTKTDTNEWSMLPAASGFQIGTTTLTYQFDDRYVDHALWKLTVTTQVTIVTSMIAALQPGIETRVLCRFTSSHFLLTHTGWGYTGVNHSTTITCTGM
jgi:hypothetical protein